MNIDRRHCRRAIPALCAMLAILVMTMCALCSRPRHGRRRGRGLRAAGRAAAGERARARGRGRRPVPVLDERDRQGGGREGLRRRALPALPAEPRGRGEHPRRPPSTRTRTATRSRPLPPQANSEATPKWQRGLPRRLYRGSTTASTRWSAARRRRSRTRACARRSSTGDVPMTVGGRAGDRGRHARVGARGLVGHLDRPVRGARRRGDPGARRATRSSLMRRRRGGRPAVARRRRAPRRKRGEAWCALAC